MTWTTYKASDVGFNAQFGGYEGHFTMTPAWSLEGNDSFKVNSDNGYVTQIEYMGRIFQHHQAGCVIGPAIAQGLVAMKTMESMARQPEIAGQLRSTMILALGLIEALTIYGLLIAFMLVGKM